MSTPQNPRAEIRGGRSKTSKPLYTRGGGQKSSRGKVVGVNGLRSREASDVEAGKTGARRDQGSEPKTNGIGRGARSGKSNGSTVDVEARSTDQQRPSGRGGNGKAREKSRSGSYVKMPSPLSQSTTADSGNQNWRNPAIEGNSDYPKRMQELWESLKKKREKERKDAIKNGILADPDKPTTLANAITPVGTCQEMCPEFERVERIVQLMVDGCEKNVGPSDIKFPCEALMVKRFRRSAAGYDEQLPSDIRPPRVLQRTLNYLIDQVVGGPLSLAKVHKFVWDRTRGIRNDFSIQQVTKVEDLQIAIDCFERIARFHILSLHQLSHPTRDNGEFDDHQEREQLNKTLLSLMYYYDDSRHKLKSPNEAEFRAYCIILEIQAIRPDTEDRAANWPKDVLKDPRVQVALGLYRAAGNSSDNQGPLLPRTTFAIAQEYYGRFWSIVNSPAVTYLMGCVAEIYFGIVRSLALGAIWKAYKRGGTMKLEDWILGDVADALGFDTEEQAQRFCEDHGFRIGEREDGEAYLDVTSVGGKWLEDANPRRKQIYSKNLVEHKRLARKFPAVINGLSLQKAQAEGHLEEVSAGADNSNSEDQSIFLSDASDNEEKPNTTTSQQDIQANPFATSPLTGSVFGTSPNPFQLSQDAPNPTRTLDANPFTSGIFAQSSTFTPTFGNNSSAFGQPSVFVAPSSNTQSPFSQQSGLKGTSNAFDNTPNSFGQPSVLAKSDPPFGSIQTSADTSSLPNFRKNPIGFSSEIFGKGSASVFGQASTTTPPQLLTTSSAPISAPTFQLASPSISNTNIVQGIFAPNPAETFQTETFLGQSNCKPNTPIAAGSNRPLNLETGVPGQSSEASFIPTIGSSGNSTTPFETTKTSNSPFLSSIPSTVFENNSLRSSPSTTSPKAPNPTLSFSSQAIPNQASLSTSPFPAVPRSIPTTTTIQQGPFASITPSPKIGASFATSETTLFTTTPASTSVSPSHPSGTPKPLEKRQTASTEPLTSGFAQVQRKAPPQAENIAPKLRSKALDRIADAVVCQRDGILQQFVEYLVSPMITKSIAKVKRERVREEIANARRIILSKKYFRKWKAYSWKRSLNRKGREMRKIFAQSMHTLAMSRGSWHSDGRDSLTDPDVRNHMNGVSEITMPPSSSKSKRDGLISQDSQLHNEFLKSSLAMNTNQLNSRKSDHAEERGVESRNEERRGHKRSKTLGNATKMSHTSGIHKPNSSTSLRASLTNGGLQVTEALMKEARHIVPQCRIDTTRTDYFRLKALGIDPYTTLIPETRKRRMSDQPEIIQSKRRVSPAAASEPKKHGSPKATVEPENSPRLPFLTAPLKPPPQPPRQITPPTSRPASTNHLDDEDEALFTQMRQVREAMSESITWFREEREKTESRRSSSSADRAETEKERKLREFTYTPSRTEQRLKATGAHGLLPKDFWDKGKNKAAPGNGNGAPQGFAALRNGGGSQGFAALSNGGGAHGFGAPWQGGAASDSKGGSADDAIEL